MDKTRAIYYWLADNIEYDYMNFDDKTVTNEQVQPQAVFLNRKAACEGYSNLFKYMLKRCNIESEVISGYARNDIQTLFLHEPNHAWNSIKLNNKWYLFDVTWARDTVNKKVNNLYFQTDPEIFVLHHYPSDNKWLLTKNEYSLGEFMKFPVYTNLFFDLNFTKEISKIGFFDAINDTVTIKIKPRFECQLLTTLYDLRKQEWIPTERGQSIQGDGFYKLFIPRKGKFVLKLGDIRQENDHKITLNDPIVFYTINNE